jgi:hypothetical protein
MANPETTSLTLGNHDVRSAFDTTDQVRDKVGSVGKVRVHEHRRISLRAIGAFHCLAKQFLDTHGVTEALAMTAHRQRKHPGIALEHFSGKVVRAIVQDQQLILPGKTGEYLANLPKEKPDGRGFVVTRYADVNHDPSRE